MVASVRSQRFRKHASSQSNLSGGKGEISSHQRILPSMQVSVLVLNRNYTAVHVLSVQRAFCLLFKGSAEVISVENDQYMSYDFDGWREISELKAALDERDDTDDWIRSVNFEIQVPRIIRLLSYDRVPRNSVKFNRRNIFLRDGHCCQYCLKRLPRQELSLDHVVPRSRGGVESWENIVCACLKCNVTKGGRTPQEAGMTLKCPPVKPKRNPLLNRKITLQKYKSWRKFVSSSD
ncbi:MAG: HNH endonuclease [Planctomycetaceae bacterium]